MVQLQQTAASSFTIETPQLMELKLCSSGVFSHIIFSVLLQWNFAGLV